MFNLFIDTTAKFINVYVLVLVSLVLSEVICRTQNSCLLTRETAIGAL